MKTLRKMLRKAILQCENIASLGTRRSCPRAHSGALHGKEAGKRVSRHPRGRVRRATVASAAKVSIGGPDIWGNFAGNPLKIRRKPQNQ